MRSHAIVLTALLSVTLLAGCASRPPTATPETHLRTRSTPLPSHSAPAGAPHSLRSLAGDLLAQAKQDNSFKKALLSGILALRANDNSLVLQAGKYALSLNPDDAEPYILLAKNALVQAKIEAAAKYSNQAYKTGGLQAISLIFQGPVDSWINLALSNKLMKSHKNVRYFRLFAARYALDVGQYRRSLLLSRQASSLRKVAVLANLIEADAMWGLGRHNAAIQLMETQHRRNRSNHFITGIYAGFLARMGNKKRAEKLLGAMEIRGAEDLQTQLARASVDVSVGDLSAAQRLLTALLQEGKDSAGIYNLLGEIAAHRHHWGEAFGWYHRVIQGSMVGSAQVSAVYALSHWKGAKPAEAYLSNLGAVLPGYAPTWAGMAATLAMKEHKPSKALQTLQEATTKYPMALSLRYQLGVLAARVHRKALALRTLRQLHRLCPKSAIYMNAYGYTLAEYTDRFQRAEALIRKALSRDPRNGAYLDSMGWVLYRQGEYRKALPYLKRAWHRTAGATVAYHLTKNYMALGDRIAAQKVLLRALHQYPGAKRLLKLRAQLHP